LVFCFTLRALIAKKHEDFSLDRIAKQSPNKKGPEVPTLLINRRTVRQAN
jgi:hypothetical protein